MVFIQSLSLTNLLSFGAKSDTFELGPLNVLIGPNGSGKSNLIEAIGLLQSAPGDVAVPVREGGGVRDWLWKGAKKLPTAVIDAVLARPDGDKSLRYRLSFTEVGGRFQIVDERIENKTASKGQKKPFFYFGYEKGRPMLSVGGKHRELRQDDIDPGKSILAQRQDPDQYPEVTYLGREFARMRLYREWSLGHLAPSRVPQPADLANDFLSEDARNLGLVLSRLCREPEVKKQVIDQLQRLYAGLDDFQVIVEGGTVQVFLHEGRWTIPATRLSDGTLRYLALLSVLCHPKPPPLVCIEEPELGLHPDILPSLAELCREASARTQLVVTTHSDVLVDTLTDTPEAVIICEKHEGITTLRRLHADALRPWLDKYRLGELWTRGELGGTRW